MGSPQDNDAWNAKFATKFGTTVIALNYAKAPKNAFPGPIHVGGPFRENPECRRDLSNEPRT